MNNDVVRLFHELWLGMVQPIEGLVVSVPVLLNAQCYERQPPSTHRLFLELCNARRPDTSQAQSKNGDAASGSPRVSHLPRLLAELLQLTADLW